MADLHGFNAHDVEPSTGFDPIPAGKYLAMVTDSEMKPTKDGNGNYLQLTFEVLDGQFKGRRIWARLNLHHSNEQTVKIARGELSAICRAAGVMTPRDSSELHNLPMTISVGTRKRPDTGESQNVIRSYAKKEATNGQPQQGGNSPWKKA